MSVPPLWLRLAVVLLLLWLLVLPIAVLLAEAWKLSEPGARAPAAEELRRPLENSLVVAAGSVLAAGIVGIPLAFLMARGSFPGRRLLGTLLALPVALPPLVGALAYLYLWGESGALSRILGGLLFDGRPAWTFQGLPAILVVHTGTMYVYFYLFVRAALARLDPALEEAARSLGAGRLRRLRTVLWPQVRPAVGAAALLTFLMALGSFSAPYLFGGNFRVLPTQILASKQNGDLDAAELETAVLLGVALLVLLISTAAGAWSSPTGGSRGGAPRPGVAAPFWRRLVQGSVAGGMGVVLLSPLLTLGLLSLVPRGSWTTEILPPQWGLDAWKSVLLEQPDQLLPLVHSAWMALVATGLALPLGWLAARAARAGGGLGSLAQLLLALPWAVPATAFALALAVSWSGEVSLLGRAVLVGTPWLLPLAYLLRSLPTTGQAALAGLARLDPALVEAARSLGAGWLRTEWRVVAPILRPALLAAGMLSFVTAFGDFVVAIVLYSPQAPPVSIEILAALRLGETGVAAVHGTLLVLLGAAAFLAASRLESPGS